MEVDNESDITPAEHACAPCKKNKRRCDKRLPTCGSCLKFVQPTTRPRKLLIRGKTRTGRVCDYADFVPSSQGVDVLDLQRRVRELEEHVQRLSTQTPPRDTATALSDSDTTQLSQNLSTQAYYLDADVWSSQTIPNQPQNAIPVPDEIFAALGSQHDVEVMKAGYFGSVHTWMPFISKIRVNRLTQSEQSRHMVLGSVKTDMALLLVCMSLVQAVPDPLHSGTVAGQAYKVATQVAKVLELNGILTLRTLQANVLLVVYELGHGIYPEAFMRISQCARQGVALGLHDKLAPQFGARVRGWVDWEERQRVWWMIVILDRYIALGGDHRPLCVEDPGRDTLLPADDNSWDSGDMVLPERISLSSGNNIDTLTPFARLAQASNLLGRVIRHCNDTTLQLGFVIEDFEALYQALYSLLELLPAPQQAMEIDGIIARTICYSALFKLSDHHSCDMFSEDTSSLDPTAAPRIRACMQKSLHIIKDISEQVTALLQGVGGFLIRDPGTLSRVSPFMLHCFYTCAQNVAWMALETDSPRYLTGRAVCEEVLGILGKRWRVAGVYLELLRVSYEGAGE
ncbi:hypothetical protein BJX99DRAFT_78198 [Aspergillus californicus]